MTRLALVFSLLIFLGCDISRDLRRELFACDAGGFCERDSGVMQVSCPLGNTCTCQEGNDCSYRCSGDCTVQCRADSNCDLACTVAQCETICEMGAVCNITCSAATCNTTCLEGSTCNIDCPITSQCTCTGPACPF